MPMPLSPPAVASLIARNLVPIGGVIFLGWSAPNLLAPYFVDTTLSLAAVLLWWSSGSRASAESRSPAS